jgi:hypothetical protein
LALGWQAIHITEWAHQQIPLIFQQHRITRPTFDMLPSSGYTM